MKNLINRRALRRFCFLMLFHLILLCFSPKVFAASGGDSQSINTSDKQDITDRIYLLWNEIFNPGYANEIKVLDRVDKDQMLHHFNMEQKLKLIDEKKIRIDIGKKFYNEIIDYNDRLDYYDLYIKYAKQKGYVVTSYIDYLTKYKNTNQKVLILRHDIDDVSKATKDMFDIERKNDVKATYYFRWVTFDTSLIKEISEAGFEVGLHYETLGNYSNATGKVYISDKDYEFCRGLLKEEIKKFKKLTGVDIKTISSHGNPRNRMIGIPNNVLLKGQNYKDFGIVSETYDADILKNYINCYICDSDINNKFGYSYNSNPLNAIMNNKKVIEFLSHPSHWDYDVYTRAKLYLYGNHRK